jgi:hypothetical protein
MGGLLAPLVSQYTIVSNKESGYGRADHILTPIAGRGDHAIIMEYKAVKQGLDPKDNQELDHMAEAGLAQIDAKAYAVAIKQQPHVQKISKISLVFCGKSVVWRYQIDNRPIA